MIALSFCLGKSGIDLPFEVWLAMCKVCKLIAMPIQPQIIGKRHGPLGGWNTVPPDDVLFGTSSAMAEVREQARRISRTNIPILLTGDGGTGKEAMARWIHANSEYSGGEFVKVNCAAIPGTLLESELFGFERGAFTGANFTKPGRVEIAHRGTLFVESAIKPNGRSTPGCYAPPTRTCRQKLTQDDSGKTYFIESTYSGYIC